MAKLGCPCGAQLSSVCSPNQWIHHILTDVDAEELFDDEPIDGEALYEKTIPLWECYECGRLALGDNPIQWYKPEERNGPRVPVIRPSSPENVGNNEK